MKIVILRRTNITHLDGVNNFIFSLVHGLGGLGHSVEVVTWSYHGVEKIEDLEEWACKTFGVKARISSLNLGPCKGNRWTKVHWDWFTKGSRLLSGFNADAVIMNGVVLLRCPGKKIAVNHGIYEMRGNWLAKMAARRLYKGCARVCVSNKLATEFRDFFKLDAVVIPLPLRLSLYRSRRLEEREDSVIHVGTRPVKNLKISIEAVRILNERGLEVRLVVVGPDNDYAMSLLESAERSGIDVERKGSIPVNELADLYSSVKALVLPSTYEGLSYATLESLASGTPVVVSRGIPEEIVTSGYNGFRIDTYYALDYAKALERLFKDEELWIELSINARESVSQFDCLRVAEKYVELASEKP
jgi:glycosyltransferase involved in cell wall biosynthesis